MKKNGQPCKAKAKYRNFCGHHIKIKESEVVVVQEPVAPGAPKKAKAPKAKKVKAEVPEWQKWEELDENFVEEEGFEYEYYDF